MREQTIELSGGVMEAVACLNLTNAVAWVGSTIIFRETGAHYVVVGPDVEHLEDVVTRWFGHESWAISFEELEDGDETTAWVAHARQPTKVLTMQSLLN